jgi:hypothetical protein
MPNLVMLWKMKMSPLRGGVRAGARLWARGPARRSWVTTGPKPKPGGAGGPPDPLRGEARRPGVTFKPHNMHGLEGPLLGWCPWNKNGKVKRHVRACVRCRGVIGAAVSGGPSATPLPPSPSEQPAGAYDGCARRARQDGAVLKPGDASKPRVTPKSRESPGRLLTVALPTQACLTWGRSADSARGLP